MSVLVRLTLCAGILAVAWTGLRFADGDGDAAEEPGSFCLAFLSGRLDLADEAAERLEARYRVLRHRIEAKRQLVEDLLRDERTMLETAACFQELDRDDPDYKWEAFRLFYPGASDDERHCREVLASVQAALWSDECVLALVLGRLQQELQHHLARGPIRLPML